MSEEMSDRPTFKPGERVRVTVVTEWTVKSFEDTGYTAPWLHAEDPEGGTTTLRLTDNVTVERITPPRTWTDGDVVLNPGSGNIWERIKRGNQHRWAAHSAVSWLPDDHITQHVAEFGWTVLRYQAEEQGA